jgi:uncharacterized membrane protein
MNDYERLETILRISVGAGTFVAGLDKFFNYICEWEKYLAPQVADVLPMSPSAFMKAVGVVEMAVGAGVLVKPISKTSAWIASAWLLGIAGELLMHPVNYKDISVRDFHIAMESFALAELTRINAKREEVMHEDMDIDIDWSGQEAA